VWWLPDAGRGFEIILLEKGLKQKDYYTFQYVYTHDFMKPQKNPQVNQIITINK
jgi:hypothetical protein